MTANDTGMNGEIRTATAEDAPAIREMHERSIRELGAEGYGEDQVDAWARGATDADYETVIESDSSDVVVAERDGNVVGFGTLVHEEPDEYDADVDAEITAVYVDPVVSRRGFGSALYRELERRAREAGHEALGLWSSRNAVDFYDDHEFESVTEHEHTFSPEGEEAVTGTVLEMRKEIRDRDGG